jgi:hypothetical protein
VHVGGATSGSDRVSAPHPVYAALTLGEEVTVGVRRVAYGATVEADAPEPSGFPARSRRREQLLRAGDWPGRV